MAEAYLTDSDGYRSQDVPYPFDWNVPYPFDWDTISEYGIRPQLTITLSPEETRELMVAAESSIQHKHSDGGSSYATLQFNYSHYFYKNRNSADSHYYMHNLNVFLFGIKPDQGISSEDYYETAPNEWVSFTYTKSFHGNYHYWKRTSSNAT